MYNNTLQYTRTIFQSNSKSAPIQLFKQNFIIFQPHQMVLISGVDGAGGVVFANPLCFGSINKHLDSTVQQKYAPTVTTIRGTGRGEYEHAIRLVGARQSTRRAGRGTSMVTGNGLVLVRECHASYTKQPRVLRRFHKLFSNFSSRCGRDRMGTRLISYRKNHVNCNDFGTPLTNIYMILI